MKYLSIITLLACSFMAHANSPLPDNRHISITGKAQLKAKPDTVVVSLEVESLKSESAQAKKEVDDRVNDFLAGINKFGIDKDNVSASNISTRPSYRYSGNKQVLEGYRASRSLKVTFNAIDKLSDFMDFALEVEINQIRNVEFKSSKEEELKQEVLALAVKDAKQKGKSLAAAFDAKLGKIYSINSSANHYRNSYGANDSIERMEISGVTYNKPASPGQYLKKNIIFSSSINVVFDLDVD